MLYLGAVLSKIHFPFRNNFEHWMTYLLHSVTNLSSDTTYLISYQVEPETFKLNHFSLICWFVVTFWIQNNHWNFDLKSVVGVNSLMSRIERWYSLISTSYLAGLFDMFILLFFQNCVCFGDFLPMRTLSDAYHKEIESHYRSILDISQ